MFKRLIIAILIGLLSYPPFAFAGGAFDSKTFSGLEPDTYDSCILYWNQGDARMYGDGSFMTDGSGGGNHLEQALVGASQPVENATYLHWDGTDDYMSQEVIASHATLTPADSRCSFAAGASWLAWDALDFSAYNSTDYEVVLTDSGGLRRKGVLSATLGGGITWSASLFDAGLGDFDDGGAGDEEGWIVYGTNTLTTEDLGGGNYALKVVADGTNLKGAYIVLNAISNLTANQVPGSYYTFTFKTAVSVVGSVGLQGYCYTSYVTLVTEDQTSLTDHSYSWNSGNSTNLTLRFSMANGETIWLDDTELIKMTDCGTGGVYCTWGTGETGFDINDVVAIEIRKSAYSVTGDLTIIAVIQPDAGRPASDEVILGKMDETNSFMGYGITLDTAGKLVVTASNDGAVNDNFITDAAVYADGAQASFSLIGFTYDASASNIDIYVSGAEVDSTEAGDVSTAIYDTADGLDLGRSADGNYFAGNIAMVLVFSDVLTAAEHMNIYNQLKRRFGL